MRKKRNDAAVLKALNELEEIILGSYNAEQPIGFCDVFRCRELLRQIEKELCTE